MTHAARAVEIAPSTLTADFGRLAEAAAAAEAGGAALMHLDVMDGHFVPPITFGQEVVRAVRAACSLPIEAHMMVERPGEHFEALAAAGAERLIFHIEATDGVEEADALIEHTGKLIVVYDQITSSLRGRSEAEHDIKEIAKKIEGTEDGQLKDALVSSAVARQNEINQYKASEETKVRIAAKVKLAEVALYEIKAKLSTGAIGAEPDDLQQDELAGMVSRLKSLSASFDEAEEMVKDRIQ